jgi:hypothetical protein
MVGLSVVYYLCVFCVQVVDRNLQCNGGLLGINRYKHEFRFQNSVLSITVHRIRHDTEFISSFGFGG